MEDILSAMKIALGSDHAGFELKLAIKAHLEGQGHAVLDVGTHSTASCDYPDFAQAACRAVLAGTAERAVLVCGTGIGISIAANRHPGIRCALVHDVTGARLAREHNDANVLALGARMTGAEVALDALRAFLATPFAGGRHERRVRKLSPDWSPRP